MIFEFMCNALKDSFDVAIDIIIRIVNLYVQIVFDLFGEFFGSIFCLMSVGICGLPLLYVMNDFICYFREWFIKRRKSRLLKRRERCLIIL